MEKKQRGKAEKSKFKGRVRCWMTDDDEKPPL